VIVVCHRQGDGLTAGGIDGLDHLSEAIVEPLAAGQRPGSLLQGHGAQAAQLPPHRHPMPGRLLGESVRDDLPRHLGSPLHV
jgi:hypothetical protein